MRKLLMVSLILVLVCMMTAQAEILPPHGGTRK